MVTGGPKQVTALAEAPAVDGRHNLRMPVDFLQQQGRLITRQGTFTVQMQDVSAGGFGVEVSGQAPQFKTDDAELELDGETVPVRICYVKQSSAHAIVGLQRRDWSPSAEQLAIEKRRLIRRHRSILLHHYLGHRNTIPLMLAIIATGVIFLFASGVWRPSAVASRSWNIHVGGSSPRPVVNGSLMATDFSRNVTAAGRQVESPEAILPPAAMPEARVVLKAPVPLEHVTGAAPSTAIRAAGTSILVSSRAAISLKTLLSRQQRTISETVLSDGLRNLTSRGDAVVNGTSQTGRLDLGDESSLRVRWSRTSDGIVIEDITEIGRSNE